MWCSSKFYSRWNKGLFFWVWVYEVNILKYLEIVSGKTCVDGFTSDIYRLALFFEASQKVYLRYLNSLRLRLKGPHIADDKPVTGRMTAYFTNAHMRQSAKMSCIELRCGVDDTLFPSIDDRGCALSVYHLRPHIWILGSWVFTLSLRCYRAHAELKMIFNQNIVNTNISWKHGSTKIQGKILAPNLFASWILFDIYFVCF